MKKVFVVLVLFISVFLIGSVAESFSSAGVCQDYWCTYITTCDGVVTGGGEECTTLCTDGFYGDIGGDWYGCDLIAINQKNLLGEGGAGGAGAIACSVNLHGRSMSLYLSLADVSCIERHNCVPCDGCCNGG